MTREFFADTLKFMPGKVIPAAAGILLVPLLAHGLTPDDYGRFAWAMTILNMIAAFFVTWLVSANLRLYPLYGIEALIALERKLLYGSIFLGSSVWSVILYFKNDASHSSQIVLSGVFWLLTYGLFEYYAGWLRITQKPLHYSLIQIIRSICVLSTTWFAVSSLESSSKASWIIFAAAISMLLSMTGLPQYLSTKIAPKTISSRWMTCDLDSVLKYGLPYAATNLLIISLSTFDRLLVDHFLGPVQLAIYAAHYDVAEKIILFINSSLLLSSSVIGYKIYENEGAESATLFLEKLILLYIVILLPILMGFVVLAEKISSALFPPQYNEGWLILPIISLAGIFVGIMHRYALILGFHKRSDLVLKCALTAFSINVFFCAVLIPVFKLGGAAAATLLAYISWLLAVRFAVRSYCCPKFPWLIFGRAVTAIVISALSLHIYINILYKYLDMFEVGVMYFLAVNLYVLLLMLFRVVSADMLYKQAKAMLRAAKH